MIERDKQKDKTTKPKPEDRPRKKREEEKPKEPELGSATSPEAMKDPGYIERMNEKTSKH